MQNGQKRKNLTFKMGFILFNHGNVPAEEIDIHLHFPDGFELIESSKNKITILLHQGTANLPALKVLLYRKKSRLRQTVPVTRLLPLSGFDYRLFVCFFKWNFLFCWRVIFRCNFDLRLVIFIFLTGISPVFFCFTSSPKIFLFT